MAEDAEVDGAGVAGCVVAEDDGADGAGCVVGEADFAGTAGFASATGFEGAGVPAFEGAAAVAAAAFTACWQPDDSFARLLLRHCSAWEPPRGTLLQ